MADNRLDDADLFELAPDALVAIADVATLIGIKNLDRNFGRLGGELAALSEFLDSSTALSQEATSKKRIRKLLSQLERVCTVRAAPKPRCGAAEILTVQCSGMNMTVSKTLHS